MAYNPLPLLITAAGCYLLFKLRFFFILHPIRTLKLALGALKTREKIASFTLALAGTLGVGNVFGVAVGIIVGGAGSIFWLFVSALFSAVIKYCEVTLAGDNLAECGGGMFYAIRNSYPKFGHGLSRVYGVACLLLAFVMGAALQIHTVGDTCVEIFNTPPTLLLIFFILLVLFAVLRGQNAISKVTLFLIPLTTIIYIIMALRAVFGNIEAIPAVTRTILSGAMSPSGAAGGIIGFLFSRALTEGYSRGILSNEAGAGTSTIAHTSVHDGDPVTTGVLGILEVFFDTTLLCTLTGYAVLLTVPDPSVYNGGMSLIFAALGSSIGPLSPFLIFLCVGAFAYSTAVCWYYYGLECIKQLTGKRRSALYLFIFILALALGWRAPEGALVVLSDILLLVLSMLSLPTLIKSSDRIKSLSELHGLVRKIK